MGQHTDRCRGMDAGCSGMWNQRPHRNSRRIKAVIWKNHVRDRRIALSGSFKRSAGRDSGEVLHLRGRSTGEKSAGYLLSWCRESHKSTFQDI